MKKYDNDISILIEIGQLAIEIASDAYLDGHIEESPFNQIRQALQFMEADYNHYQTESKGVVLKKSNSKKKVKK
jgi:hypothetical protein